MHNQSKGPKGFSVSSPDKNDQSKKESIEGNDMGANFTIMPMDVPYQDPSKADANGAKLTLG